jgi:nucleoside-diphosphate kinase
MGASNNLGEKAFVIIKPDALQRGLAGEILSRFERKGLKVIGLKMVRITPDQAARQYECHKGKPFYQSLIDFMISGPSIALVLEGNHAVQIARKVMGATDPVVAEPGTIRGDYSVDMKHNLVHGSDSGESFKHEMPIYFTGGELFEYDLALKDWLNFS